MVRLPHKNILTTNISQSTVYTYMYISCGCSILSGEYESVILPVFGGEYIPVSSNHLNIRPYQFNFMLLGPEDLSSRVGRSA